MKRNSVAVVCAALLLALSACEAPSAQMVEPSPIPTVEVTPAPPSLPPPSGEPEQTPPKFPVLVAENEGYTVFLDRWFHGRHGVSTLNFSVYDAEGEPFQSIQMQSDSLIQYEQMNYERDIADFEDLNFDGIDDLKVTWENIRNGAYDAFLWDEELEQFVEEPTFTEVMGYCLAVPEEQLVFGWGSSSASSGGWSAFRYDKTWGYRQEGDLLLVADDAGGGGSTTERFYENGKAIGEQEIKDRAELSEIWKYLGTSDKTD